MSTEPVWRRTVVPALLALLTLPTSIYGQRPRADSSWRRFEGEIRVFQDSDRRQMPPPGGVLFVGSSSIRNWESLARDFPSFPVINRGFGDSQLADVLHYADRIIVPYAPSTIVLYAGDNDLAAGKSPSHVFADYRRVVAFVQRRLPGARLIYVSIKPSPARWRLKRKALTANTLIKRYAERRRGLAFVDVFTPMLDSAGRPRPELFVEDSLHMNVQGYALWTGLLMPVLAQSGDVSLDSASGPIVVRPAPRPARRPPRPSVPRP